MKKTLSIKQNKNFLLLTPLKRHIIVFTLLLFLIAPLYSHDEEISKHKKISQMSLEELMNIKVKVSSVIAEDIFKTTSTVSIIDEELISQYNFASLADALESVAGLDIYQTIIDRNVTTIRGILQNFYANKILLMINNIPTWQPIYGAGYIERININDVKRIEILKGPASVLYGSNAYTGVINIILNDQKENGMNIHLNTGAFKTFQGGINFSYNKNDLKLFSSFNVLHLRHNKYPIEAAKGFEYNNEASFNYEHMEMGNSLNFELSYKEHKVFLNRFDNFHTFQGIHPSYSGGGGNYVTNSGTLINYKFSNQISKSFFSEIGLTYDYFFRKFPVTADKTAYIALSGERLIADAKFNYKFSKYFSVSSGLQAENRVSLGHNTLNGLNDIVISHNLKNDDSIFEYAIFSEINFNLSSLNIVAGTRYTKSTQFGGNISSRVTGIFSLSKNNSIKFMIGQSFRVPTMFELYFDHPTVIGNDQLEPEKSLSYEIAYLTRFKNFFVQILGYYANYKSLIQRFTPETGPPSIYKNVSDFSGYGIEVELKYRNVNKFNCFLNYNYIKGIDEKPFSNYTFVPDHKVYFGINKILNKVSISTNGKYISKTMGFLGAVKPQFFLNFHIAFKHEVKNSTFTHKLSFTNITNSKMLIPEYIRKTENLNTISTTEYGTEIIYSLYLNF